MIVRFDVFRRRRGIGSASCAASRAASSAAGSAASRAVRGGMTLVELLVVISIMMILTAVVLPRVNLGVKERKTKNAADMVSVYFNQARNRAIETGRPCGVLFERIDDRPNGAGILYQVQEPLPYSGDTTDAVMKVIDVTTPVTTPDPNLLGYTYLQAAFRVSDLSDGLVRNGDLIQIGGQGPWYEIVDIPSVTSTTGNNPFLVEPDPNSPNYKYILFQGKTPGNSNPVYLPSAEDWIDTHFLTLRRQRMGNERMPYYELGDVDSSGNQKWSGPFSFTIRRQPIAGEGYAARSMVPPLKLPKSTTIDLSASGVGSTLWGDETVLTKSLAIMFGPSGAVSGIYGMSDVTSKTTQSIYLLIGLEDQLNKTFIENYHNNESEYPEYQEIAEVNKDSEAKEDVRPNWQLPSSRWVVIDPVSGIVHTAEMMPPEKWFTAPGTEAEGIREARTIAAERTERGGH